jgi:hypothetical protein
MAGFAGGSHLSFERIFYPPGGTIMRHFYFLAAVLACSTNLAALTIQDATYLNVIEYANLEQSIDERTFSITPGSTSVPGSSQSTTVGTRPVLFASATGIAPASDLAVNTAGAEVSYYFIVTGPETGLVPLFLDFDLTASSSGTGQGFAGVELDLNQTMVSNAFVSCDLSGCLDTQGNQASQVSGRFQPFVHTGDTYQIVMDVNGSANSIGDSGSGYADPYIYVDPSFPGAANYSIVVSAGVGNSPLSNASTPEPASWLLVGFAPAVAVLFRRRRTRQC